MEPKEVENIIDSFIPVEAEFMLNGKEYHLRKANLKDWKWIQVKYGGDVTVFFNEMKIIDICTVVFRLPVTAGFFSTISVSLTILPAVYTSPVNSD